jgi:exodeoxyribonuclease VII large subunit
VQGEGAGAEIAKGIRVLDGLGSCDVVVVARGGGSIEDLWAFNEEVVARALADARTPTVSAVGHETDYTIADFAADVRAPTPSAAAETVVPELVDLERRLDAMGDRAEAALRLSLARTRSRVQALAVHRVFEAERGRLQAKRQRIDEFLRRAATATLVRATRETTRLRQVDERLGAFRWERQLAARQERTEAAARRLTEALTRQLGGYRARVAAQAGQLEALSPLGVVARGYALVFDETETRLVRRPDDVAIGDSVRIRVHGGRLGATVTHKEVS